MSQQDNNTWYVLIGDQKYGPYDYPTMINMLQTHQLMDYNYVWAAHVENWTPIHQLEEFSRDRFINLLKSNSNVSNSFIQRQKPRASVEIPIIGHNTIRFFDGKMTSVSESGALCLINTPLVQVGDVLKLHIKPNENQEISFNVEAEVIRKNFSKQRLNSKSGLYYAVKFNDIQKVGVDQIKRWVTDKAA